MSTSFQSKIPNSLNEHWMPFSSNKDFKKNPRIIVKAEGIHLHTHDGDRKSTRLNSSHSQQSRMPSSA